MQRGDAVSHFLRKTYRSYVVYEAFHPENASSKPARVKSDYQLSPSTSCCCVISDQGEINVVAPGAMATSPCHENTRFG